MKRAVALLAIGMAGLTGCSQESRSPDAIRNDTANATSAATRDAKAVVLGVFDGLKRRGAVNINKASAEQLEALPGISAERANAIIAHRPYRNGEELLRRHVVDKTEYNRIVDKITAR